MVGLYQRCIYGAYTLHIRCIYNAYTVHIQCIYGAYTAHLKGKFPNIQSDKVYIYGSGQPYICILPLNIIPFTQAL
jgi:hypothetical protein